MKRILSIIWVLLVVIAFSALIHSTDSAIGSLSAALSYPTIISVLLVALIIALPISFCMFTLHYHGWKGYLITLLLVSTVLGATLAFLGSTAQTSYQMMISVIAMIGLSFFVYGLGSFPNVIISLRRLKTV